MKKTEQEIPKETLREDIALKTDQFVKDGGKIEEVPYGRETVKKIKERRLKDNWRYRQEVEFRRRELEKKMMKEIGESIEEDS